MKTVKMKEMQNFNDDTNKKFLRNTTALIFSLAESMFAPSSLWQYSTSRKEHLVVHNGLPVDIMEVNCSSTAC